MYKELDVRNAKMQPAIKDWYRLSADEKKLFSHQAEVFAADETADVGIDLGTPVLVEYIGSEAKSKFTGHITKVTVEVKPTKAPDKAAAKTTGKDAG